MSKVLSVKPLGEGHINDSYLIQTTESRLVSQRIGKGMDIDILEHNFEMYAEACRKADFSFPEWIKNSEGKYISTDEKGDHWRTYPYIQGDILEPPLGMEQLYAVGQGLARLHTLLQTFPEKPKAVYPMLHDLNYYYYEYIHVLSGYGLLDERRDKELEEKIYSKIDKYRNLELDRTAVVHGDAKLANILFRSGRVYAFIDLDTIMQGSLMEDMADCIRSCCMKDGKLDYSACKTLMEGYLSRAPGLISNEDMNKLRDVINKICFELGLRYYTDSISEIKKFKVKYPEYRQEKARELINIDC